VHGPSILAASMSVPRPRGPSKALWQYHSRSDLHSKVACWGVLLDLLCTSNLLCRHALAGTVVFGINHEMRDFRSGRKKDLDLVVARPVGAVSRRTFSHLADRYGVVLDEEQAAELSALPPLFEGPVGSVLVALEAKAAMTEHGKARPRLYDELESSHTAVHGASRQALAIGLVMINAAATFVSPDLNKGLERDVVTTHRQPAAAEATVSKIRELPRRTDVSRDGFDGLGIVVVSVANDGSPVELVEDAPAPRPGDVLFYDNMIARVANEYDTRFATF
jgi:hypothetical protein